jgi:hypothetical protein
MAEGKDWYEWMKHAHPFWQVLFRATQSLSSRSENGADIVIYREKNYVAARVLKMEIEVEYDAEKKALKIYWERRWRNEAHKQKEWRIKRFAIEVDEKVAGEILDRVEDLLYATARSGCNAEQLAEQLAELTRLTEQVAKG